MKIQFFLFFIFLINNSLFSQNTFINHELYNEDTYTIDEPNSVFSFDIDADGDMDILTSSQADRRVSWFENMDGEGTFGYIKDLILFDESISKVLPADMDNDGDIDILLSKNSGVNPQKIEMLWYENTDGLGEFDSVHMINDTLNSQNIIKVADLDGDNDLDILTISPTLPNDEIGWYENLDGLGNFSTKKIIAENVINLHDIHITDIDGDNDMDFLIRASNISWYENIDGLGTFVSSQVVPSNVSNITYLGSSDMDNDGDVDIIISSQVNDKVAWIENMDGQGNFLIQHTITVAIDDPTIVQPTDFDNDGDIDLIIGRFQFWGNGSISQVENDGSGFFSSPISIIGSVNYINGIAVADFNGDSFIDIVSSSLSEEKIAWNANDGQNGFQDQQVVISNEVRVLSHYPADIDNDGDLDIVTISGGWTDNNSGIGDKKIEWLKNIDGEGSFSEPIYIKVYEVDKISIYPSDLDNDGDVDIVVSHTRSIPNSSEGEITWFENLDGLGEFDDEKSITTDIERNRFELMDIDEDGDQDIFVFSNDAIYLFENLDGSNDFGTKQFVGYSEGLERIKFLDVDLDDDLDIVFNYSYSFTEKGFGWFINNGAFWNKQIINTLTYADQFEFNDINGDGEMDMIFHNSDEGKLSWSNTAIDNGINNSILIGTVVLNDIKVVDVGQDGDMDIIGVTNGGNVYVFTNIDGQGNFSEQFFSISQNFSNSGKSYINVVDLDGDLDLDVIVNHFIYNDENTNLLWAENLGILGNKIEGKVSVDLNSNGCLNPDYFLENTMVISNNGNDDFATFSLANGYYFMNVNEGTFITNPSYSLPNYFEVNPVSYTSVLNDLGNVEVADFCIQPTQTINDLEITLFPTSPLSPGFEATYQLIYSNKGTTQLGGNINLDFDDSKISFISSSTMVISQTNNSLTFDYADLKPFETRTIDLTFEAFQPPITNIDEVANFNTSITPVIGDFTEGDNTFELEQTIIGSYDPNDIRVLEGTEVHIDNADEYLHYIIRFQNTGTASAVNIIVENILDKKLEWQTLEIENLSHDNRINIIGGDTINFIFNNIFLPDSTSNEAASHGFIAYKIKPKSTIQVGDIIANKADIFFDFNPAIETNTALTEIVDPLSLELVDYSDLIVYPIPTDGELIIQSEKEISKIEVYDRTGILVLENYEKMKIDLFSLTSGLYLCKIITVDGKVNVKKVLKE